MTSRAKITDAAYDAALNAAREAQHAYDAAVALYRARKITDKEYLAARCANVAADEAFDREFRLAEGRAHERCAELCAAYNTATNPAALLSEEEHARRSKLAKEIIEVLNRGFYCGIDYYETESGRLFAIKAVY